MLRLSPFNENLYGQFGVSIYPHCAVLCLGYGFPELCVLVKEVGRSACWIPWLLYHRCYMEKRLVYSSLEGNF